MGARSVGHSQRFWGVGQPLGCQLVPRLLFCETTYLPPPPNLPRRFGFEVRTGRAELGRTSGGFGFLKTGTLERNLLFGREHEDRIQGKAIWEERVAPPPTPSPHYETDGMVRPPPSNDALGGGAGVAVVRLERPEVELCDLVVPSRPPPTTHRKGGEGWPDFVHSACALKNSEDDDPFGK